MNRVAIFLRKKLAENKFRDVILSTLRMNCIDSALLCSGFFQEDSTYSVSKLFSITAHRHYTPIEITTVGLYAYGDKKKYTNFISGVTSNNCTSCLTLLPKVMPGMKWHAKVFVASSNSSPVVAAIGSSNITKRAFDTLTAFNYECDVIFWDESNIAVNSEIEKIIGDLDDKNESSVIVSNYDQTHRVNKIPLRDRLAQLELEILTMVNDLSAI